MRLRSDAAKTAAFRRIDIGALIEEGTPQCGFKRASYSLLIAKRDTPAQSAILRKVHFDVEPSECRHGEEPKPTIHMQVCGKLSREHEEAGYVKEKLTHWYPNFEKPRIPCCPTSLALLLDWVMLEFQSDANLQRASGNPRWRAVVGDAEQLVLKPFFDSGAQRIKAAKRERCSFARRYLYELAS